MSEILKHSGLYLLAILLISSLAIDVVSGQDSPSNNTTDIELIGDDIELIGDDSISMAFIDDDLIDLPQTIDIENIIEPSIIRDSGNIAYIGSFDKRIISSYSDGSMGLGDQMQNAFELVDSKISKTRKTTTISYGSDLLEIEEISNFAGYDISGNKFSANYGKFTTLKNFDFPFAIIRDDEMTISGEDLSIEKTQSEITLLIPDWIKEREDSLNEIKSALGGSANIKEISYMMGENPLEFTQSFLLSATEAGLNINTINADKLIEMTMDEKFWAALREAALNAKKQQDKPPIADEWDANEFSLASGGIECVWGYKT
jgi:hypothetical protein